MNEQQLLSVKEFADEVGITIQAVYGQLKSNTSKLSPYAVKVKGQYRIKAEAVALYHTKEIQDAQETNTKDYQEISSNLNQESQDSKGDAPQVEQEPKESETKVEQEPKGETKDSDAVYQAYISHLEAEIQGLRATIEAKDAALAEQSQQLAALADKLAAIAHNAIGTVAGQQYITAQSATAAASVAADERSGDADDDVGGDAEASQQPEQGRGEQQPKKSWWARLWGR